MKKIFVIWLLATAAGLAQNFQVHYDFTSERRYATTTLEMFKPDALGATFWFVDFDYNSGEKNKSASTGYWELARYFTLPVLEKRLSATVQYNDGLIIGSTGADYWGAPLYSVWLGGLSYFIPLGAGNISVDLLYRYMDVSDAPDAQLTLVWFYPFFNGKLVFTGYVDLCSQDLIQGAVHHKKDIWMGEPQLWYVLNNIFSVGGEVEISRNFGGYLDEIKMFPTIGIKWTF